MEVTVYKCWNMSCQDVFRPRVASENDFECPNCGHKLVERDFDTSKKPNVDKKWEHNAINLLNT